MAFREPHAGFMRMRSGFLSLEVVVEDEAIIVTNRVCHDEAARPALKRLNICWMSCP